jgi:hypothetical protein
VNNANFVERNSVRLYKLPIGWGYDELEKHVIEEMKTLGYGEEP